MCSVSMELSPLLLLNVLRQRHRRQLHTESLKLTGLEHLVKVKPFSEGLQLVCLVHYWRDKQVSAAVVQRLACIHLTGARLAQKTCLQCHLSLWPGMCVKHGVEGEGEATRQKNCQGEKQHSQPSAGKSRLQVIDNLELTLFPNRHVDGKLLQLKQ